MKNAQIFDPDRPVKYLSEVSLPILTLKEVDDLVSLVFNLNEENFQNVYNYTEKVIKEYKNDVRFIYNIILRASIVRSKNAELYRQIIKRLLSYFPCYFDSFLLLDKLVVGESVKSTIPEPIHAKLAHLLNADSLYPNEDDEIHYLMDFEQDSLGYYIKYDMLEIVQEITGQPNFEFEQSITFINDQTTKMYKSIVIDPDSALYQQINFIFTPLSLACFFGSLKLFKYFILNDCEIRDICTFFSIHGYNFDIIHILEQKDFVFNNLCFEYAVLNYRNDIADWLLLHYSCEVPSIYSVIPSFNVVAYTFISLNTYILQQTPIMNALQNNSQQQIKNMELSIKQNKTEDDDIIELNVACRLGFLAVLKYIFEHKKKLSEIESIFPTKRKLIRALSEIISSTCQSGCSTTYKYVMESFSKYIDDIANFQVHNPKSKQALYFAVMSGSIKMVKSLIEYDFDVNGKQVFEENPEPKLNYSFGSSTFFIEGKNNYFSTPLHLAVDLSHIAIVKLLLENGAVVDSVDTVGRTPFHLACMRGNMDIVDLLIKEGKCDIHKTERTGHNAMHYACMNDNINLLEFLLKNGFTVNDMPRFPTESPLIIATKHNRPRVVQFLIEKKVNVNYVLVDFNTTALHYAAEDGYDQVLRILLDNGAKTEIKAYSNLKVLFSFNSFIISSNLILFILFYIIFFLFLFFLIEEFHFIFILS